MIYESIKILIYNLSYASPSFTDQLEVRKSAGFGGLQMLKNSSICNGRLNRKVFWTFQFILLSLTHNFFK
jgi:hypothetical protein